MTDQKTIDAATAALMKTYYDRRLIETLKAQASYYQFGMKKPIPVGRGKTIEFTYYHKMLPMVANTGEFESTQVYHSSSTISATLIQRANHIQWSALLGETAIDPGLKAGIDELGDMGSRSVDLFVREKLVDVGTATRSSAVLNSAKQNLNSWQGDLLAKSSYQTQYIWSPFALLHNKVRMSSSAAALTNGSGGFAGTAMSVATLRHAASYLKSKNAKTFDGVNFVAIMHPWTIDQLLSDPAFKTWNKYNDADKMFNHEVGKINQCRIVSSTSSFRYVYSAAPMTTASGALNATLVMGKDCFGVTELDGRLSGGSNGYKLNVIKANGTNTADPNNKKNTAGIDLTMAATHLNKTAAAVILTTEKAVSSAS